jgi:ABC-type phosphate transport system permease subunit
MSTVPAEGAPLATGRKRGVWSGRIFVALLLLSMAVGFVALGTLCVDVLQKGLAYVDPVLLKNPPSSDPDIAGARPAILATLYLGILLILFTVPIGVGTAIYLEEYADRHRWYNRLLELNIQNLAAVPPTPWGRLSGRWYRARCCPRPSPGSRPALFSRSPVPSGRQRR